LKLFACIASATIFFFISNVNFLYFILSSCYLEEPVVQKVLLKTGADQLHPGEFLNILRFLGLQVS
ncbi:hypothetical protein, partial [Bullifex porci]|uniref:hypothetical protein n=1 Tax=Bullifex porci TaxID=2606638 RepID=UPI0023EFAF57